MISFKQTDAMLLPEVQLEGCAVLDCLYLLPDDVTITDVNTYWGSFIAQGILNGSREIASWARLLAAIHSRETITPFPLQFSHKTPNQNYQCEVNEREILKWSLSNVKEDHFTVGGGGGVTAWDSMDRPDIMEKYATFVEKIIVEIVS